VASDEDSERTLIPPGDKLSQQRLVRRTRERTGAQQAPKLTKKRRAFGSSH
jgi:hypothetical protein